MSELKDRIIGQIVADFYDKRIMSNLVRAHYVERMIAQCLGEGWDLVSADWSGWDLQNSEGVRAEVKQSAALQTWTDQPSLAGRPTRGRFDIAPRTGYWTDAGSRWIDMSGRLADLYVFGWHPITDRARADHRDPDQWVFYVVPEAELPPNQKTIGQRSLDRRWSPVTFEELEQAVLVAAAQLQTTKAAMER